MGIRGSYKDLVVWQKSMKLVIAIYQITSSFPKEEIYGLTAQMRRASVSIPSNIAEGNERGSQNDFKRFIEIAKGSTVELRTQNDLAFGLTYLSENQYLDLENKIDEIIKMLSGLSR